MDIKKQLNVAGKGARLVAKQAERLKVINIDLPGAYRKLGEKVFREGNLRDQLENHFTKIQLSIDEQEKLNQPRHSGDGFAEKMKAAAIAAKNVAVSKKIEFERGGLFTELGRLSYEGFKEELSKSFSTNDVVKELQKLSALDHEIALLSSVGKEKIFNPKNVAYGLVAFAGLVFAFVGYKFTFGGKGKLNSQEASYQNQDLNANQRAISSSFLDVENKSVENKKSSIKVASDIVVLDNPKYLKGPNGEDVFIEEILPEKEGNLTLVQSVYLNSKGKKINHGNVYAYFDKEKKILAKVIPYKNSKRDGQYISYNSKGALKVVHFFTEGKFTGHSYGFDNEGNLSWSVIHNPGSADISNLTLEGFIKMMNLEFCSDYSIQSDSFPLYLAWNEAGPISSRTPVDENKVTLLGSKIRGIDNFDTEEFIQAFGKPFDVRITNIDKKYPFELRTCVYKLNNGFLYLNFLRVLYSPENSDDFLISSNAKYLFYPRSFFSKNDFFGQFK